MIKFKKLTPAILLATALAIFSGCSMLDASVDSDSDRSSTEIRTTGAVITNFSELFQPDSRSILPDAWTFSDIGVEAGKLHFYVYGEATNGTKTSSGGGGGGDLLNIPLGDIDTATGAFTMNLAPYNWTLTLIVSTKADSTNFASAKNDAVLIARAHVDLTSYTSSAKFYLTSVGLEGSGKVKGDIKLDSWKMPTNTTATIGIYDFVSDIPIMTSASTPASTVTTGITTTAFSDTTAFSFGGTDGFAIKAGIYNFKVTFTTAAGKKFVYSDSIVVVPEKTTDCTLSVPAIIDKIPDPPTELFVAYDKTTIDAGNLTPDTYSVFITWTDNANNESGFRLQVQSFGGSDLPGTAGLAWATGASALYYDQEVVSNEAIYVDGSLQANNNCIVLRLPLGKKYGMRLCATNDAGDSTYATWTCADPTTNKIVRGTQPGGATPHTFASLYPTITKVEEASLAYFYGYDVIGGNPTTGKQRDTSTDATLSDTIGLTRFHYYIQGGKHLKAYDGTASANFAAKLAKITAKAADFADPTKASETDLIVYYAPASAVTALAAGAPLWKFDDNLLNKNNLPITQWRENTTTGTARVPDKGFSFTGTPYTYTGYENVDWYADYNQQAQAEFEDKSILEPHSSWVIVKDSAGTPNSYESCLEDGTTDADGNYIETISFATAKPDLTIEVTVPDDDEDLTKVLGGTWNSSTSKGSGGKYDKIKVCVKKAGAIPYSETKSGAALSDQGTATVFTWAGFDTGRYTLEIVFTKGTETRTKTLVLIITD